MAESVSNTEPDFPSLCKLEICGAVYGKCDVTEVVKKLIQDESLTVKASNDVFGDTWKRHNKTLVIVYKYDGGPNSDHVKQAILKEGDTLRLTPPRSQAVASLGLRGKENSQLKILGATYGLADVTNLAQSLVTDGGEFNQMASNEVWGNSWPGVKKTLVVVYTYSNTYMVDIAIKGQRMHFIASPPLCILGAVYGLEDVTTDVQHLVKNRSFSATANNSTFGNGSWRWRKKSLVIVYQYGDETPTVATAKQDKPLEFRYAKSPEFSGCRDPSTLTILGAAYGPRDVTQVVQSRANNNVGATFHITANNDTFSDTLRGHKKSFVVVYRYGYDAPQVQAIQEGQSIQWGQ